MANTPSLSVTTRSGLARRFRSRSGLPSAAVSGEVGGPVPAAGLDSSLTVPLPRRSPMRPRRIRLRYVAPNPTSVQAASRAIRRRPDGRTRENSADKSRTNGGWGSLDRPTPHERRSRDISGLSDEVALPPQGRIAAICATE